jgi:Uncharacterised nucleotidyltransferase
MRQGMDCLLEILRGQSVDREIEETEWAAMLALAEEERVLPWIVERLRSFGEGLPQPLAERLGQIERDATIAAFYWSSHLKGLLHAFHHADIPVVPLKGPVLAQRLYGGAALRMNRDLDLLVSKADFSRAEAVLVELGFTPGELDDYHRPWYRHTATVELHYDVENPLAFDFGVESAMRDAEPTKFEGEPCRQLASEDELAYLCLHAARHRYERLCLVLDLRLAFEKLPGLANGREYRCEIVAMNSLLTLGLAMARRLQPDLCVKLPLSSGRDDERLERLADVLWDRLLTQSSEPLDWSDLHAFYLEIERPGWARLRRWVRHLQILSTRMIEPDYRFAARFGMHRTWQVRMLRPLRLLSASIQSQPRG